MRVNSGGGAIRDFLLNNHVFSIDIFTYVVPIIHMLLNPQPISYGLIYCYTGGTYTQHDKQWCKCPGKNALALVNALLCYFVDTMLFTV